MNAKFVKILSAVFVVGVVGAVLIAMSAGA